MSHEQESGNHPSKGPLASNSLQETQGKQYKQRRNEEDLEKRRRLRTLMDTSDESNSQEGSDEPKRSQSLAGENKDGDFANFCIALDNMVPNGRKGKQEILIILWLLYQSHIGRKD